MECRNTELSSCCKRRERERKRDRERERVGRERERHSIDNSLLITRGGHAARVRDMNRVGRGEAAWMTRPHYYTVEKKFHGL